MWSLLVCWSKWLGLRMWSFERDILSGCHCLHLSSSAMNSVTGGGGGGGGLKRDGYMGCVDMNG